MTVYMHENITNGKVYIGKTSTDVQKRWGNNGIGYKKQQYFWRAIQKYGWDGFNHIIVATDRTKEEADRIEIGLIKLFDSTNPDKGYNITAGGEGTNGWHPSDETKKKISESKIGENNYWYGKKLSDEHKNAISIGHIGKKAKKVAQYDLDGNLIKVFDSISQAAKETGVDKASIIRCCKDKQKIAGGFMWGYYGES